MAKSNVVVLPKSETRIAVERHIKSHNEVSKKRPLPIAETDFNMTLDFSTCSPADIMAIAVDQIVIAMQAKARTAFFAKTNIGKDGKTPVKSFNMIVKENIPAVVNVQKDVVEKARKPGKSLLEKTGEYMKKLSPEERTAMLKQLAAMK